MSLDDNINHLAHSPKALANFLLAFASMPKSERDWMLSCMRNQIDAKKKFIEDKLSAIRKRDYQEQQ